MNKNKKFSVILSKFFLIFLIIIPLNCCKQGKAEIEKLEAEQPVIKMEEEFEAEIKAFMEEAEKLEMKKKELRYKEIENLIENLERDIERFEGERKEFTSGKKIQRSLVGTLVYNFATSRDQEYQLLDLIPFINGALKHKGKSFYEEGINGSSNSVMYSYDTNGNYLFVNETEIERFGYRGGGYSRETTYIFDTKSIKLIPIESIFKNANAPNPLFHKLVIEYLYKDELFSHVVGHSENEVLHLLPKAEDSIIGYGFNLFYAKEGMIGMRWPPGSFYFPWRFSPTIVLPYSKAQDFLTETGKEIFN